MWQYIGWLWRASICLPPPSWRYTQYEQEKVKVYCFCIYICTSTVQRWIKVAQKRQSENLMPRLFADPVFQLLYNGQTPSSGFVWNMSKRSLRDVSDKAARWCLGLMLYTTIWHHTQVNDVKPLHYCILPGSNMAADNYRIYRITSLLPQFDSRQNYSRVHISNLTESVSASLWLTIFAPWYWSLWILCHVNDYSNTN